MGNIYVPLDYSDVIKFIQEGEEVIYSTNCKVEVWDHNYFSAGSGKSKTYKYNAHVVMTKKGLAFHIPPQIIYDKSCLVCHLSKGEGLIGPNLTDQYWMYGGSIEDVIDIIVVGVPSKGMISWKDQLSPKQIQEVSSFILSLQGTNPPNAKEPQGELYNPE